MAERCDEVRQLVPELALGVAPGDERARALAHIETCPRCRAQLERAAATADELLLLAPEHEPPTGFDTGILHAMQAPRRRRRTTAVLAAAAVLVAALGTAAFTWWAGSGDREVAAQYRHTLDVGDGSSLRAAYLKTDTGVEAGHVFAYQGEPSWIFMTVSGAPSGYYGVTLVTADGRVHDLGWCTVRHGTASWGVSVDVPIRTVDHVEMRKGGTILTAQFRARTAG
jgi:hypothetical protein